MGDTVGQRAHRSAAGCRLAEGASVISWVMASYEAFAFVLVGSAGCTALWAGAERRKDAYKVYKVGIGLLAGSGGIIGVVVGLTRLGMWPLP